MAPSVLYVPSKYDAYAIRWSRWFPMTVQNQQHPVGGSGCGSGSHVESTVETGAIKKNFIYSEGNKSFNAHRRVVIRALFSHLPQHLRIRPQKSWGICRAIWPSRSSSQPASQGARQPVSPCSPKGKGTSSTKASSSSAQLLARKGRLPCQSK